MRSEADLDPISRSEETEEYVNDTDAFAKQFPGVPLPESEVSNSIRNVEFDDFDLNVGETEVNDINDVDVPLNAKDYPGQEDQVSSIYYNTKESKLNSEVFESDGSEVRIPRETGPDLKVKSSDSDFNIPEPPKRKGFMTNEDGTVSSHKMITMQMPSGEDGEPGEWVSFPSLFQNEDGSWVDMSNKPWEKVYLEAQMRNEIVIFGDDQEAAEDYGKGNWKKDDYFEEQNTQELDKKRNEPVFTSEESINFFKTEVAKQDEDLQKRLAKSKTKKSASVSEKIEDAIEEEKRARRSFS